MISVRPSPLMSATQTPSEINSVVNTFLSNRTGELSDKLSRFATQPDTNQTANTPTKILYTIIMFLIKTSLNPDNYSPTSKWQPCLDTFSGMLNIRPSFAASWGLGALDTLGLILSRRAGKSARLADTPHCGTPCAMFVSAP